MERIYRKHSSTSHSPEDRDSYYDPEPHYDEEYEEKYEEHEGARREDYHDSKPLWKQDRDGRWKNYYMRARERAVERTANKEKSEPFYEYLQLIPNPDFFRPHVEFEKNDRHHDDDKARLQEQRMQEQR